MKTSRTSRHLSLLVGTITAALGLAGWLVPLHGADAAADPGGWSAARAKGRRVLYFTKSAGYEHSVVKRPAPDQLSHSERILTELGTAHGFAVTCTKDGTVFTREKLAGYDAIAFFTSGLLTTVGEDRQPAMTPEGKAALLQAVSDGKGFVAIHAANDSFHVQPDPPDLSERFVLHGDRVDPYIAMLGGEFIRHGPQQSARMKVVDNRFPGCEGLSDFEALDEWYTFKDFAPDLHAILVQETKGMTGLDYQRPSYPSTWARRQGKGRVFYTAMGHREDVWTHPRFQAILLGGLGWAAGNLDADTTPNLQSVTPGHRQLQPREEPK